MAAIYTANHLEKHYGGRVALRDVSFSIEPGKLVGLLGPNGAMINNKQRSKKSNVFDIPFSVSAFTPVDFNFFDE